MPESGFFNFSPVVEYRKRLMMDSMGREKVTLASKVREYLSEIGRRGGLASRRDLTRQQAKLMVAIREEKRTAAKKTKARRKRRS